MYLNIALIHEKMEDFKEALRYIAQAERIDPSSLKVIQMQRRLEAIQKALTDGTLSVEELRKKPKDFKPEPSKPEISNRTS